MSARLGLFGAAVGALLVYGCTTAPSANSALRSAQGASASEAVASPSRVDNFLLADADLRAWELHRMSDQKAVVLVTQSNGDAVIRSEAPALKALKAAYAAKGVQFLMLNSNLKDSREAIQAEAAKAGYDTPVLMDSYQLVGESLGVTRSAEVIVIDPRTWKVAWRGALADGGAGKALDALTAGQAVPVAAAAPGKGAAIAFPARAAKAEITYVKDVAPILEARCVACHEEGGIGPFAMTNYATVKGFAPMIREVIRTHRMPPYDADPHVGKFSDDRGLSAQEVKTVVHWIEAGAPRGEGKDPLGAKHLVAAEWPLGKPDVVIDIPAYTIPASGVVDYQHPWVANPGTEGKWLRAATIKVEARAGVHHVLTGLMTEIPKPGQPAFENQWGASVGTYAVGFESEVAPKNAGTWIPAGGAIGFQNHYTPFGKETTDHTKLAFYYYKDNEKPGLVMHTMDLTNNAIEIPPNDSHHVEVAYMAFPHDALLYAAFVHAHYRGTASDLSIRYPDGREKLLLSLPRYQFGWQRYYTFAEPVAVPAGSKLIAHYVYDNSKTNPANPDPNKTIIWGPQSWEEMFFTRLRYRWMDETSTHLVKYDKELRDGALLGNLDANMDGKIEKAELKGLVGKMLLPRWDQLDTNHDGVLDKDEIAAASKLFGGHRQEAEAPAPSATPVAGGR
ncbi:redoxin family protein [Phenylobacterium sp.]|uniref:redoxin family protein n=1 Tax=Phenylobacterium sp. TaxID=1871053 RepID=UPI002C6EDFC4|nr:redoxin family protein [Phenylobacterium sp.]HLZ75117.1 redoxin family protein [Phenylobacterium sp.]